MFMCDTVWRKYNPLLCNRIWKKSPQIMTDIREYFNNKNTKKSIFSYNKIREKSIIICNTICRIEKYRLFRITVRIPSLLSHWLYLVTVSFQYYSRDSISHRLMHLTPCTLPHLPFVQSLFHAFTALNSARMPSVLLSKLVSISFLFCAENSHNP